MYFRVNSSLNLNYIFKLSKLLVRNISSSCSNNNTLIMKSKKGDNFLNKINQNFCFKKVKFDNQGNLQMWI